MSGLRVEGLRASVAGKEVLRGVDLEVPAGEVHVVMGRNGSGKSTLSHVLAGKPGYEVLAGAVTLDGVDLLSLPAWERAKAGLLLALQYPVEVPGVSLEDVLVEAAVAAGRDPVAVSAAIRDEAGRIGFDERLLDRSINVDLSGGERKRNETIQIAVLRPRVAILDEIDSGLDVDGLRDVARRIRELTSEQGLGVLAITHYARLLEELPPDRIHVFSRGRIVATGGPELADELERTGYAAFDPDPDHDGAPPAATPPADPFADPFA
jgi:Fe-S cluster assembly ATP-binding protein